MYLSETKIIKSRVELRITPGVLRNLKNLLKILILTLILVSCKKGTEQKTEFNLKTDITDFKKKMTESDTIKIWFNHSVCTYREAERIEITKKI